MGRWPEGAAETAAALCCGEATREPSCDEEPRAAHLGGGGSGVSTTGVCVGILRGSTVV